MILVRITDLSENDQTEVQVQMKRLALLALLITAAGQSQAEDLTEEILNVCNGYASIAATTMNLRQGGWPIEDLYRRAKDDTGREIILQAYALPMVDDPNQQAYLSKIFSESTLRQCLRNYQ